VTSPKTASRRTIAAAKAGDRGALEEIFRIYHPALLRYLRVRSPDFAEDVASQTWISVAKSIDRFDGNGAALRGWILTIGYRRLADEYRRRGRRLEDVGEVPETIDEQTPEGVTMSKLGWAQALVSRLPPRQADVVMMRVIGGLSVDQVAEATGLSKANVRVLAHRGLAQLHRMLTDETETEPDSHDFSATPVTEASARAM
jgi:RNA polymerase sigma-70 factor (ECF subfamily)